MKVGTYLDALEGLPFGTLADLVGREPFLVCSPHPDDETLGCGGLLLQANAAGIPAAVLILTDGAGSHPGSREFAPPRLAHLRRREASSATAELGLRPDRLHFLDLPDAASPSSGPAFEAAVAAIVEVATDVGARTLFVTSGRDPHCDHETAFAMACRAARRLGARLWAYPIWSLHLPREDEVDAVPPNGWRLDVAREIATKRRALARYASQMTPMIADDPAGFVFTEAQLAPFLRDHEIFVRVSP